MSALGQKQTFAQQKVMSALPPKADMCSAKRDVRFVPIADIGLLRLIRAFVKIERRFVLCIGQSEQDMTKADGTLNVRLAHPHKHRADFTLRGRDWPKPDREDWFFEECKLTRGDRTIDALILKTTADFWGPKVLEVMAEEHLRSWLPVADGQEVEITLR
jgi:Domain of unknown function DUF120